MAVADLEFIEIHKTYTTHVDGRAVTVHGVPFLEDPETHEHYLDPQTSERLYELVRNPSARVRSESSDVYDWGQEERHSPLKVRFQGPSFQYGEIPVGRLATTINRVSDATVPTARELALLDGFDPAKLDPSQIEPRVPYIGSGSLVIALDYPREALHGFAEHTSEKYAVNSIKVLADALGWASRGFTDCPETLSDARIRAVALKGVRRLIPRDFESSVEVRGELLGNPNRRLVLRKENRLGVQQHLLEAIAQATSQEQVTIVGTLNTPDIKGKFNLTDTDQPFKHASCTFDHLDPELKEWIGTAWGKRVQVFGFIVKKLKRGHTIQVLGIEFADEPSESVVDLTSDTMLESF
jgi:hypothetical protein